MRTSREERDEKKKEFRNTEFPEDRDGERVQDAQS